MWTIPPQAHHSVASFSAAVTFLTWLIRLRGRLGAEPVEKDNGVALVDGRQRAVLELAGRTRRSDALAVAVGDLLQLQGGFEGDGAGKAVAAMLWD
jgi:hypothetical protein